MRRVLSWVLAGVLLGGAACHRQRDCGGAPEQAVRLALNWFPEAEHGGFYAAQVRGLFAEAGVPVEILGGGPDAPVIQRVATGDVTFAVTNADDVLLARAQQVPVVALMASYQVNPRCIMVHTDSGIESIAQLRDVTLAMSPRPAFSHYLRRRFALEGVRIVPYPGNVTQFLLDHRYAQQGYVFSEPYVARSRGADPRALLVAETGFSPYASVLIATEETLRLHPQRVGAVVRATVRGWEEYLRDPALANEEIHRLNPEMPLDILAHGARESRPLVLDTAAQQHGIGHMTQERWETLVAQLVEAQLISPGAVEAGRAYTTAFLP
ncbi:MAG: ABC transporter substrate-binding protein [Candidatus Latescibacterota bacterium]